MADPLQPVRPRVPSGRADAPMRRGFQGIPGLEVTRTGRLWATWYSGGSDEGPDNFVLLAGSADGGRSWNEPVAVVAPSGDVRAYDPVLWHDPAGRLWWFWAQCLGGRSPGMIHDGRAGVWGVVIENPDGPAPVFSAPIRIANGVMMNKPTVLADGTWVLPSAVWEFCEPKLAEVAAERFSNITVSTDGGRSFRLRGGADVPRRCFDEHMVVELRNGRLWMLVRTGYGIGQSFSADGGRTWTPGKDSGLGGPNSRFFIRRLASGRLLLVNHADQSAAAARAAFSEGTEWRPRSHLTAFVSCDDGRSWSGGLLLDERPAVSYPDGVEDRHGVIRIIYDRERQREGEILMASFREEDVLARACVTADASLKTVVSRTGGNRQESP